MMAGRVETAVRARPVRLALVLALAAAALWSFAPYAVNDIGTQAAVNAPLVRIVAPIDGTVGALPAAGDYLSQPRRVELIRVAEDAGTLGEAAGEAAQADAAATLAEAQLAELKLASAALGARARVFRHAAEARLTADLRGAEAAVAGCTASVAEASAAHARAERLSTTGFLSAAGLDRARAEAVRTQATCDAAVARRADLMTERAAAAQGVLLADGANDQPYSAQQRDRLDLKRQELEATMLRARSRATAERARLAAAQARATPVLPAGLYVWSLTASPGSAASAGQPLLDLADCRRRFVDVALAERRAEAITVGDPARVRLVGAAGWVTGRVARVTGSAARADNEMLAARRQARPGGREISVEVTLPAGPALSGTRRCDIGRLAEVRFNRLGG